jgi:hypothetical protein
VAHRVRDVINVDTVSAVRVVVVTKADTEILKLVERIRRETKR